MVVSDALQIALAALVWALAAITAVPALLVVGFLVYLFGLGVHAVALDWRDTRRQARERAKGQA